MEITIQRQTTNQDLMILLIAATILIAGYWCATAPHYLPISKIEEGTIVVRDDSVTTIIIPDKL
ncbi:hypothetical protein DWW91_11165 [Parabacteroides sp. AF17-3]|nr:hypothetical protein DWW91_11165 [Parabacteroides sp. AF17-3]